MTEIAFADQYTGKIGGEEVVTMYRATASPGQPYCIVLPGLPGDLSIELNTAHIGEEDDDWDHVAEDRAHGQRWVVALTRLIWTSREYDRLQAEMAAAEVEAFIRHPAFVVDKLTSMETDQTWEDCDGDRYQADLTGAWYQSLSSVGDGFLPLDPDDDLDQSFLTDFGPYTAVRKVTL